MKTLKHCEVNHRKLKQTCGIEYCMSRSRDELNATTSALQFVPGFIRFKKRLVELTSFYRQQWPVIKNSITANMQLILA